MFLQEVDVMPQYGPELRESLHGEKGLPLAGILPPFLHPPQLVGKVRRHHGYTDAIRLVVNTW